MVYPGAHTEWTISFIKFMESIMCMICLIFHIMAILHTEEPMPHIVLFCASYGGFFILSVAGMFVPISGQYSPPGVDFVFASTGFFLFYLAGISAMHFAQRDPHLSDPSVTDAEELHHPFFTHCWNHSLLSIIAGTLFLMHAMISSDRLYYVNKGMLHEDLENFYDSDEIDIDPNTKITLHLFLLDWLILFWNTKCCISVTNCIKKCCGSIHWCYFCKRYKKKKQEHIRHRRRSRRTLGESNLRLSDYQRSRVNSAEQNNKPNTSQSSVPPHKK